MRQVKKLGLKLDAHLGAVKEGTAADIFQTKS
jgi:hypothetical protein